jgi:hypothetical protein
LSRCSSVFCKPFVRLATAVVVLDKSWHAKQHLRYILWLQLIVSLPTFLYADLYLLL